MNSDKLFTETVNLGRTCIDRLMKSSLPSKKGIYSIGEFEAMLFPLGNDGPALDFWEKGKRKQKFVRITDLLIIFRESKNEKIILSDFAEIGINKFIGEYPSFPLFEFFWTGNSTGTIPKGRLKYARVDLSGSNFMNYNYDIFSQKYDCFLPKKIYSQNLDLGFPENLEKVNEIFGVSFERVIDFDKEAKAIKKSSGLEGFNQALLSCV